MAPSAPTLAHIVVLCATLAAPGCYDAAIVDPSVTSAAKEGVGDAAPDTAARLADGATATVGTDATADAAPDVPADTVLASETGAPDVPAADGGSPDLTQPADTGPMSCTGDAACGTWLCKSGKCAPCAESAECAAGKQCLGGKCLPVLECQSDKACQDLQMVCSAAAGKCVECVSGDDCAVGEACLGTVCLGPAPKCTSTKQCPSGQICDKATLSCMQCAASTDCSPDQTCIETVCVPKVCSPGQSKCIATNAKAICLATATGWSIQTCGPGQSCDNGACTKWLCPPDKLVCMGSAVVQCSADGLSTKPVQDCEKLGKKCKDGACVGG